MNTKENTSNPPSNPPTRQADPPSKGSKAGAKKATLPSDPAALKALDTRIGQEMARCARDYDDARTQLKEHHGKMASREASLAQQIAALQPSVDGLLDGTGPGLTKAVAQDCLKYMKLNAQLHTTRQGKRLAYGATVPPGEQRLGGAIGDPLPGSVPEDVEGDGPKGGGLTKSIPLSNLLAKSALTPGYSTRVPHYDDGYGRVEAVRGGKVVGAMHFHHVYKENASRVAVPSDTAHIDKIEVQKQHRGNGVSSALYAHFKKHLLREHPNIKTVSGKVENPIALRARSSVFGHPDISAAGQGGLGTADANRILAGRKRGDEKPSVMVSHTFRKGLGQGIGGVKVAVLMKAHVHAYTRMVGGKSIYVREHEDSRTKHPIFYSTLHHVLHEKMQHAAPAEQVRGLVRSSGVSPEETKAMGLDAALEGKGTKVYKQALVNEMGDQGVHIDEVRLGAGGAAPAPHEWKQNESKKRLYLRSGEFTITEADGSLAYEVRRAARFVGEYRTLERAKEAAYEVASKEAHKTKYEAYTLPGGTNYRELLLTVPDKRIDVLDPTDWVKREYGLTDSEAASKTRFTDDWQSAYYDDYRPKAIDANRAHQPYVSSHWDEKNVLGHLRLADHTDTSGHTCLLMEEAQSDIHQDGRKKGYRPSEAEAIAPVHTAQKEYETARDHFDALIAEHGTESQLRNQLKDDDVQGERHIVREDGGKVFYNGPSEREALVAKHKNPGSLKESDYGRFGPGWEAVNDKLQTVFRARKDADAKLKTWQEADDTYKEERKAGGDKVPDMPFKKNWHELLFKRALHEAVDGGYDKIAWPTGDTQAERYDLSKQIDYINYHVLPGGDYSLHAQKIGGGNAIPTQVVSPDKLDDVVGKEIADKMRRMEGEETLLPPTDTDEKWDPAAMKRGRTLSGDGLKVGGEGMKGFYSKMLPEYVAKYTKKWGGSVNHTELEDGKTVHSLTITPEMREAILKDGQPLWGQGVAVSKGVGARTQHIPDTRMPLVLLKAIDGATWHGSASYATPAPRRLALSRIVRPAAPSASLPKPAAAPAMPKPASILAEGLPRTAAHAAASSGMYHQQSAITGINTRKHTFAAASPVDAVSHLHEHLVHQGFTHVGTVHHVPGLSSTIKMQDRNRNVHTFRVRQNDALPAHANPHANSSGMKATPGPALAAPPAPAIKPVSAPSASLAMKQTTPAAPRPATPSPVATPFKVTGAKIKAPTAAPTNHLNTQGLADSIGGDLHDVQSRIHKPAFGKAQEQHAHLISHTNPNNAVQALHAHLSQAGGKIGAIHEQRVPHADGGMAHLYSFDHTDSTGAKHTIHVMRSANPNNGLKPKAGASPLGGGGNAPVAKSSPAAPAPKQSASSRAARVSAKRRSRPAAKPAMKTPIKVTMPTGKLPTARRGRVGAGTKSPASASPAAATASKEYAPSKAQNKGDFESGYLRHHATENTLPRTGKGTEKALNAAWGKHKAQYHAPAP